ncbi:MAG: hypothetical protein ACRELU_11275, partial [Gemmatimonadota bacterium]
LEFARKGGIIMSASRSFLALAVCLATACASGGSAASDSPVEPATQVQAAALRHVFQNNDSSLGISAGSYCVGVGSGLLNTDPSVSLLQALENPKVTRLSGCARVASRTHRWQVIDTLSRLPSLAFFVDQPSFPDSDTARVYVEYVQDPSFSTGYDCVLSRTTAGWQVQRCDPGFPR